MASNKAATRILFVAMVVMIMLLSYYPEVGHAFGLEAEAEAYFQASAVAHTQQAQRHGEAGNEGSSRHCYGECSASCINPFDADPHLEDLCTTRCKAQCKF